MNDPIKNLFAKKASRVVRVLLSNPGKSWVLKEIADEAHVGLKHAQLTVLGLQREGYVVRQKKEGKRGLVLINPLPLLRRWASYHQFMSVNRFIDYYSLQTNMDNLLDQFKHVTAPYALTTLAGAMLIAPNVRPVSVECYAANEEDAKKLAKELDLQPIPNGGNVKFVLPYDEGVRYKQQLSQGIAVVSNVQLYVDLLNYPARGEEAAESIFDVLRKKWDDALLQGGK